MAVMSSRKAVNRIASGGMKSSKGRNLAAIIAIVLTTVLFTGLITVSMSLVDFMQQQTMRQVGTSAHAGLKFVTDEQYEIVAADPEIKDISYNIFLGAGSNPELLKHYTEIRWTEEKAAEWSFCTPEVGRLPEKENELACGTGILEALGVPLELGSKVTLEYTSNGVYHKDDFVLCGWWEYDKAIVADTAFVSEEYLKKNVPMPEIPHSQQEDPSFISGYYNPTFWFDSAWDIDGQAAALKERCGFGNDIDVGVNWAYGTSNMDLSSIGLIAGISLLIIISGCLIIYNVFAISVMRDIRFYGLIKTIGATKKQIRRIVLKQALTLSLTGIPIGLIIGWIVAKLMIPVVFNATNYAGIREYGTSINPLIFIAGSMLSLITVFIGCIIPAGTAAKVSPVEAVRWTENKQGKHLKKKRSRKVSSFSMAWANLRRSSGKTAVVIIGLSFSIILLNCVYTVYSGFDLDKYLKNYIAADFTVTDVSVIKHINGVIDLSSVSQENMNDIMSQPGIVDGGAVYYSESGNFILEGKALEEALYYSEVLQQQMDKKYLEYILSNLNNEDKIFVGRYGVSDYILPKINLFSGSIDKEKLHSGDYVIVSPYVVNDNGAWESFYDIGEKVKVNWDDGTCKEYEVMAIGEMPYALGPHYSMYMKMDLILPESEYLAHNSTEGAMSYSLDMEDSYEEDFEKWIADYTNERDSMHYVSRKTYADEFKAQTSAIVVVGSAIAGVIGLISILNFINSMATSVFSRRREIAVMQSMGMTGKQLNSMLIWEGLIYNLGAIVISIVFGSAVNVFAVKGFSRMMDYFTYHFTVFPILLCIPVLVIFSILVPVLSYKGMCREIIIERLRESE